MTEIFYILAIIIVLPLTQTQVATKYFWRPRLYIDMRDRKVNPNVPKPYTVSIDEYRMGMVMISLASSVATRTRFPHLDPSTAHYYTNLYRWSLRYLSFIPTWLGGEEMSYPETHKVWRNRFQYMDAFVPEWMRRVLPFVDDDEWHEEELQHAKYLAEAEEDFGQYYVYP